MLKTRVSLPQHRKARYGYKQIYLDLSEDTDQLCNVAFSNDQLLTSMVFPWILSAHPA
jgi:hypothetical protein